MIKFFVGLVWLLLLISLDRRLGICEAFDLIELAINPTKITNNKLKLIPAKSLHKLGLLMPKGFSIISIKPIMQITKLKYLFLGIFVFIKKTKDNPIIIPQHLAHNGICSPAKEKLREVIW